MDSAINWNGITSDGKHLKISLSEEKGKQNSHRKTRLCHWLHTHQVSWTSYYKNAQQFCHMQKQEKYAYFTGKENERTHSMHLYLSSLQTLCCFLKQPCLKLLSTIFSNKEFKSHKFIQSAWGHRMNMCYPYHRPLCLPLKIAVWYSGLRGGVQTCCAAP